MLEAVVGPPAVPAVALVLLGWLSWVITSDARTERLALLIKGWRQPGLGDVRPCIDR